MENETTKINFKFPNHNAEVRTLKDGKIIEGLIQKTEAKQVTDMKKYCKEKKLSFSSNTVIEINGSEREIEDALDFYNDNSKTEQVFVCPFKLEEEYLQVLYCLVIKEMDFDEIGKELGFGTARAKVKMKHICDIMNTENHLKMRDLFKKHYSHYIYSNIKVKGKPRGKSGNQA